MARKTVNVSDLLAFANDRLSDDNLSQECKRGVCVMLEKALHDSGNYHGFNNTYWLSTGFFDWEKAGSPKDNKPYIGKEYDRTYYRG